MQEGIEQELTQASTSNTVRAGLGASDYVMEHGQAVQLQGAD